MMPAQLDNEAWMESYMVEAMDFLSEKFNVKAPNVVLNCEETCPWASGCRFLACYMSWNNNCNFKSGSEKGQIASHEFTHHLQEIGIVDQRGEAVAVDMEAWWNENVSSLSCEICGSPLFADDDMVGSKLECDSCGSIYEVVNVQGYPDPDGVIVSKNALLLGCIVAPVGGVILGAFVFDTLPKKGLSREEYERRTRRIIGETALAGFIGTGSYFLISKTPAP